MDGISSGLRQSVPVQTRLGVESGQCQRASSVSCVMVIAWISASWRYSLSNPLVVGGGETLKALVMTASARPHPRLGMEITPSNQAQTGARAATAHVGRPHPSPIHWVAHSIIVLPSA
jgi:hypothetical protein